MDNTLPYLIPPEEPNPALYRAVLAQPDSDAPRLAYADWFEDHGDRDRARFIRLQCQLDGRLSSDPEYSRLRAACDSYLYQHGSTWLAGRPQSGYLLRWEFLRGFPEWVVFDSLRALHEFEDRVFPYYIRRLDFANLRSIPRLARLPSLQRVRELELASSHVDDEDVQALVSSPYLDQLTRLNLANNRLGLFGIEALVHAHLPNLQYLDLGRGHAKTFGSDGIALLARSPLLAGVTTLNLSHSNAGDEGLRELAASPYLGNLRHLDLSNNGLTAEGLAAVLKHRAWPQLQTLRLINNPLGNAGAEILARASHWESLRVLVLQSCRIGDEGVQALADAPHLSRLQELLLTNNFIGNDGARAIAASPHLSSLVFLSLAQTLIGQEGGWALGRSTRLTALRGIDLHSNAITPVLMRAISDRFSRQDRSTLDQLAEAPPEVVEEMPAPLPLEVQASSSDEAGLLHAIVEDPEELLPRQIYADWLEDQGEVDRAEILRAQLDQEQGQFTPGLVARLLENNRERWIGPLEKYITHASFDRGMLHVHVSMRTFLTANFQKEAPALFAQARVHGLHLDGKTRNWEHVAGYPLLGCVRELTLNGNNLHPQSLGELLSSPHLAGLHTLRICSNRLSNLGLILLGRSTTLPRLRRLLLIDNGYCNAEGLGILLAWPQMTRLTSLSLSNYWLLPAHAAQLASASQVANLRRLDLSGNRIQDSGASALSGSAHLSRLRSLNLERCGIQEEGAVALANSPHLHELQELVLRSNAIGDVGARALAAAVSISPHCRLVLSRCGLSTECKEELIDQFGDRITL